MELWLVRDTSGGFLWGKGWEASGIDWSEQGPLWDPGDLNRGCRGWEHLSFEVCVVCFYTCR